VTDEPIQHDDKALADATLLERAALDNGSGVDAVVGALAREVRRTQRDLAWLRNRVL
jgi:hypothetical protein